MATRRRPGLFDRTDAPLYEFTVGKSVYNCKLVNMDPHSIGLGVIDERNRTGNPRLWNVAKQLRKAQKLTARQSFDDALIYKAFTDPEFGGHKLKESLDALITGLMTSGRTADPVIVTNDGEVAEGTRRTVAYRVLKTRNGDDGDDGEHDGRFDAIPVILLPPEASDEDILALQNQYHNVQKKPWDSVDRAAAAAKLRDEFDWTATEVANYFGWKKVAVDRYFRTYDLLEEYQSETRDFAPDQFTKLWKVTGNRRLQDMMFVVDHRDYNPELWPKFKTWMLEGKINDCRHVNELTGKKYNLLDVPAAIRIIGEEGTTAAIDFVARMKHITGIGVASKNLEDEIGMLTTAQKNALADGSTTSNVEVAKLKAVIALGQQLLETLGL